jgi:demethylmenaquinone methyltransferase/2-methoxy-6-polyprenyl-1,4-benzoquinol methylase
MNRILEEQKHYYRERAPEYDEWFYRLGSYDRGSEWNNHWFEEVSTLQQAVTGLGRFDSILELACGTGIWTQRLAAISPDVTAVDASPEVIEINRCKIGSAAVEYLPYDIFEWQPGRQYDLVFFAFWLSHVPPERLEPFLRTVSRGVKPGGRIFAIDSLPYEQSAADQTYQTRTLKDGREFRVVKIYYDPSKLKATLERHGFQADVQTTGEFFWYASCTKQQT